MRIKLDLQDPLEVGPARLKVTGQYYQKYRAVDRILAATPEILGLFYREVSKVMS